MNIQKIYLFKKFFLQYIVPMNWTLGIKLKSIDENETVIYMKKKRKILNYGGTIHGSAIMALGETVHGMSVLNRIGAFENIMVTRDMKLTFIKKAREDLEVSFKLGKARGDQIAKELNEKGVCEIELKSTITNKKGDAIAKLAATYHIRQLKKK